MDIYIHIQDEHIILSCAGKMVSIPLSVQVLPEFTSRDGGRHGAAVLG